MCFYTSKDTMLPAKFLSHWPQYPIMWFSDTISPFFCVQTMYWGSSATCRSVSDSEVLIYLPCFSWLSYLWYWSSFLIFNIKKNISTTGSLQESSPVRKDRIILVGRNIKWSYWGARLYLFIRKRENWYFYKYYFV